MTAVRQDVFGFMSILSKIYPRRCEFNWHEMCHISASLSLDTDTMPKTETKVFERDIGLQTYDDATAGLFPQIVACETQELARLKGRHR
jgi:hypothetical protein